MDSTLIFEPQRGEWNIYFHRIEKPSRLNPEYFTSEGVATEYLKELHYDIQCSWKRTSDIELKGLFVGGSQAEGQYKESSDLDVVIYRTSNPNSIPAERSKLVSELQERYQILEEWGKGKKPEDVDFIITGLPFGRLYDLVQNIWVQGLEKHPKMYQLQQHQNEVPFSFMHLRQDLGKMNQYFWDLDKPRNNLFSTSDFSYASLRNVALKSDLL
jgi:hypothetical protein